MERYEIQRALERVEIPEAQAAAQRLVTFVNAISVGDPILTPDANRKDVIVGVVEGEYVFDATIPPSQLRHRRPVRWVGRHEREDLPPQWLELYRQKLTIQRYDATSLLDHVAAVIAGDIGRPANQRGVTRVRASSATTRSSTPRAPRKPKAPERVLRTCARCGFNLNIALFEGHDTCRDCRA